MAKQKVILFLVEGESDLTALVRPFAAYFQDVASTVGESFRCDVTTVSLFRKDADFQVFSNVKETVRRFILSRIEQRRTYRWTDLERIVHVVDLDGAFVPDVCVRQDAGLPHTQYQHDEIVTPDREALIRRNKVKSNSLQLLCRAGALTFKQRTVPYQVYFMSRNLEHALFGIEKDLDADMKERLSQTFAEKCRKDPSALQAQLNDPDVRVEGDYQYTWQHVQEGTNSLHRGTNIHLLFEDGSE